MYHVLANNNHLKKSSDHNYLDNMFWWYLARYDTKLVGQIFNINNFSKTIFKWFPFRYLEKNVNCPVPEKYGLPIPDIFYPKDNKIKPKFNE